MIRLLIESIVDVVYPPEEGEEPVPFWKKLLVLIGLMLIILLAMTLRQ